MNRLAIITSHPIQYNAPIFKLLTQRNNIIVKVFYTWGEEGIKKKYDPGFEKQIEWDIPLLDGYDYTFVTNISKHPGSHHFKGIINPTLNKEIEEWGADAILVFGWSFKSHLAVLNHFKGKKKILFRGDSTLLDEPAGFSIKNLIRRFFLKWIFKKIDVALYVGTANRAYYLKHGVQLKQLIFAPHAIDNERFATDILPSLRNELGIDKEAIVFLFAGKFKKKKNPLLLLDGFVKLKNTDSHLVFVGNGELESQLKQKSTALSDCLQKRIHFLPFQNQTMIPAIYKTADIVCLPSQGPGETWGLAINEAMACSKAVLVSDKCGCAVDLVEDGANGYVFKSNDLNDLADKMGKLVYDKNKINEMGRHSFTIIGDWSYLHICNAIENCIIN